MHVDLLINLDVQLVLLIKFYQHATNIYTQCEKCEILLTSIMTVSVMLGQSLYLDNWNRTGILAHSKYKYIPEKVINQS
jgi:hypothetical protein